MKKFTILVPIRRPANSTSVDIMYTNNIVEKLREKFEIELIWLVVLPKKNKNLKEAKKGEKIVYFYEFNDAVEIFENLKPDLVITRASSEPINLALILTSKKFHVPNVTTFYNTTGFNESPKRSKAIKLLVRASTSKRIKGDIVTESEKPFNNFTFFLNKLGFLNRTIRNLSYNRVKFFIKYFKIITSGVDKIDPIFSGRLNFCATESDAQTLTNIGFKRDTIRIPGNPSFDELFKKMGKRKNDGKNEKINILFCTGTYHEHGYWSTKQEFDLISSTINEIKKHENFSIALKLHPSSSFLSEYQKELGEHENIVMYQKEELLELVDKFDVIILYGPTSAILYCFVRKKPVVYLDWIKEPKWVKKQKDQSVMMECKSVENLKEKILQAVKNEPSDLDYKRYFNKNLGKFDGKCSQRMADEIIDLLENVYK